MKIERKENSLVITLPLMQGGTPLYTSKVCTREYAMGLMKAFSQFLVESLERRMEACQRHLLEHIGELCFVTEHAEHIEWKTGQFNTISFETMQQSVSWLHTGMYEEFLNTTSMVDQLLKALLNDTEQHPDRVGDFKYSELISLLTEHHAFNGYRVKDEANDSHFDKDSARKESTGSGLWIGERPK